MRKYWLKVLGWILIVWKPLELLLQSLEHVEFVQDRIRHHEWTVVMLQYISYIPPWLGWFAPILGLGLVGWDIFWRQPRRQSERHQHSSAKLSYLPHTDTELPLAIFLAAHHSAPGRWLSAQHLASDKTVLEEEQLMREVARWVSDAAMNGHLKIRGRPRGTIDYELIPREHWRSVFINVRQGENMPWKPFVAPCSGVATSQVSKMLSYDSLMVDAMEFETLWPERDNKTEKIIQKFLKRAKQSSADLDEINRLSMRE